VRSKLARSLLLVWFALPALVGASAGTQAAQAAFERSPEEDAQTCADTALSPVGLSFRYLLNSKKELTKRVRVAIGDTIPSPGHPQATCAPHGKRSISVYQRLQTNQGHMRRNSRPITKTPNDESERWESFQYLERFTINTWRRFTCKPGEGIRRIDFVVKKTWHPTTGKPTSSKQIITQVLFPGSRTAC
jgi:hypothetical protein